MFMILSMTGFGRAEAIFEGKKINVDIKSLNSKSFDLSIKLPLRFKENELEIRKSLNDQLLRGKVDCENQPRNYKILHGAASPMFARSS